VAAAKWNAGWDVVGPATLAARVAPASNVPSTLCVLCACCADSAPYFLHPSRHSPMILHRLLRFLLRSGVVAGAAVVSSEQHRHRGCIPGLRLGSESLCEVYPRSVCLGGQEPTSDWRSLDRVGGGHGSMFP
jgi:hypothetical protein